MNGVLILLNLLSVATICALLWRDWRQQGFSFHLLFSLVYLVVFYSGLPFSLALAAKFQIQLQPFATLVKTQLICTAFYLFYYALYHLPFWEIKTSHSTNHKPQIVENREKATAYILAGIGIGSMAIFFALNGFLLFKLNAYNQIFSAQVKAVALKRFFYFFLPALLIFYFRRPSQKSWLAYFAIALIFGTLSYLIIGGTRLNFSMALLLFMIIGVIHRYISSRTLFALLFLGFGAMFLLAMQRYGLSLFDEQSLFRFLHLTRDTFSPWENFAKILAAPQLEFQGLMPILRDFYVYIPKALWADRPDLIINSANYFTWEILHYYAGLAISPTMLGAFYIMGGYPLLAAGAIAVALIIKGIDTLYRYAQITKSAVLKSYVFALSFVLIVLVREGIDAFVSRFVFISLAFAASYGLAVLYCAIRNK